MKSLLFLISLFISESLACTTFCLKTDKHIIFGKNYDYNVDVGYVYVNKRGIEKLSYKDNSGRQIKWVSKYGSVTFNQYGRESPSGGMNEAGLVIELLWLNETEYTKANRPSIDCLQWIQFQLDQSANIDDIVSNNKKVQIQSRAKVHYLITDSLGNSYALEFLGGKLIKTAAAVLANNSYSNSKNYTEKSAAFSFTKSSNDRFKKADHLLKAYRNENPVDYGFSILGEVDQGSATKWQIIYDLKKREIHFKTRRFAKVKTIQARKFDYAAKSDVLMLNMNQVGAGISNKSFITYDHSLNLAAMKTAFKATRFLGNIEDSLIETWARYPLDYTKAKSSR